MVELNDDPIDSFAPPPFKSDVTLLQMQRTLRDLKLQARGNGFELRGKRLAELSIEGDAIAARMAKKAALTPEWDRTRITSTTEQRKWLDELRRRLARWNHED